MRFSESKKGGLISKLQLTNDLLLEFRIEAKYGGYTASMELFQKDTDIDGKELNDLIYADSSNGSFAGIMAAKAWCTTKCRIMVENLRRSYE